MNVLWSQVILDALNAVGVRECVVSPGSRSTPIVLAALESKLNSFAIIDERQAAFFAMGLAQESMRPTLLICTSGSAGAHYLPALLEASYSYIPMVVVTADRPPHLQGCHAPQTIRQNNLLRSAIRSFIPLPEVTRELSDFQGVYRAVVGEVGHFASTQPGPVHINAPFSKPLERQDSDADESAIALRGGASEPGGAPSVISVVRMELPSPVVEQRLTQRKTIEQAAQSIRSAERGLIVVGPNFCGACDAERVAALKTQSGFELYCDITSNVRQRLHATSHLHGLDAVARTSVESPDWVIQIGAPPISSAIARWTQDAKRLVFASEGRPDPSSRATLIAGDVNLSIRDLCRSISQGLPGQKPWGAWLRKQSDLARECANRTTSGEAGLVRVALASVPENSLVFLGNSLCVRVADTFATQLDPSLLIRSQRGVSGIDGLIARASGHAAHHKGRSLLILGDVSFAHDLASLRIAQSLQLDLDILVVDNGGGQIFEHLPLAGDGLPNPQFSDFWLTPQATRVDEVAKAFGIQCVAVNIDALPKTLAGKSTRGPRVLWGQVPAAGAQDAWSALARSLAKGGS